MLNDHHHPYIQSTIVLCDYISVELPEECIWVGCGTTWVSTKLYKILESLQKSGWLQLQKSILKSPNNTKLEKTVTSRVSKMLCKSSRAVKLAGGRYHTPMCNLCFALWTDTISN